MLTLTTPEGRHYVTLTRLDADAATIDVAGKTVTVPLSEIDRHWDGAFLLVWRAPDLGTTTLRPGMASYDVVWLRQRLAAGEPLPEQPTVYDEQLARRVVAFQRAAGLTADGVIGDETLLKVAAAAPDAKMPSLSKAKD